MVGVKTSWKNHDRKSRPDIPENVVQATENQIGNKLSANDPPLAATGPRVSQNIMKQRVPMAAANHMVIMDELNRRLLSRNDKVMAPTFAAKTMRPLSFTKKSNAMDKSEIANEIIGRL